MFSTAGVQVSKRSSIFSTVRTEGAILPPELLMRLINGDSTLDGVKPQDYHLSPSERLNEAATRAYNRLTGVWTAFKETIARLPEDAIGTTETRERWLLPLFQELGFGRLQIQKAIEIEGKSYPISHQAAEPVAIHLVSCKWDLDKRNPVARSETKLSPHSLLQEFLNRSPEHLWGFLSNGYKLRILRNNVSLTRAAYVEFDLGAMLDNEAYSDFFLLYLLCHQSRVEVKIDESGRKLAPQTCWLERWYNTSLTEGVRALDDLRDSVQNAIESLGAGFLLYPANTGLREKLTSGALSVHAYYSQVLRQVYRLLLIFVSEDRDLLIPADVPPETKDIYHKYYSSYRIRELAQRKRGTRHTDLWQQLNLLFNSLQSGNPALGLPALGSYLFRAESTPDLADCLISNSDLLAAFRSLCYTQKNNVFQPINYRNLGPEELGSVYESLLEMSPEVDLAAGYFKLSIISGSERKTTGSYYTPTSLVNCLLDSALEPVIDNALHSAHTGNLLPEQALLALKICDPACGSGHFLIAAAHRIAKRLASIRAGEDEPAPSVIQHALRDVICHCIYGVDINPMAVELCKISLWIEALDPGKPLTFLDHHIQCGNSLLGCTPELLENGIPDAAFSELVGDDKAVVAKYKKLNKDEGKKGVIDIFGMEFQSRLAQSDLSSEVNSINRLSDSSLDSLMEKERSYQSFLSSPAYQDAKLINDAWCATFVWIKDGSPMRSEPLTHGTLEAIKANPQSINPFLKAEIQRLARQYKFFHWHLAFPDVFDNSSAGFDCVLGNPPWEHNELKEKEWFTSRDEAIAEAAGATRKKLIKELEHSNPSLFYQYLKELRYYQATSLLYNKDSGLYPLCGRGRINTYAIFAELNRKLLSPFGRCGCIVPSGIATDDTTKFFFQDLIDTGSLVSLYDFENREGLFPAVDSRMKFCLLTLRTPSPQLTTHQLPLTDFVFFAHQIADLSDEQRHFQLSAADIALINPNTHTCPIFRSKADAELTKYIYRRVPVLIDENDPKHGNPWGVTFRQGLFNMTSDSHLFKTREQMQSVGYELESNHFVKDNNRWLPLYEAKMIHHFHHRFGDYADLPNDSASTQLPDVPLERLQSANYEPLPRYWVSEAEVLKAAPADNDYFMGFRDITNSTNERTVITAYFPRSGVSNKLPLLQNDFPLLQNVMLNSCLNSFACDFVSRFKIGGTSLNFFIAKQLAVIPPSVFTSTPWIGEYILPRALELIYTSHSLAPFARDLGYDGPPFIWDEQRRFYIRCELDALFFHLYLGSESDWQGTPPPSGHLTTPPSGYLATSSTRYSTAHLAHFPIPRHAVEYIMETFPIVKRKDEQEFGEYRTKRRILEIYDQMTQCFATNTEYRSTLDPPAGPPCDAEGSFISSHYWEPHNWPINIHKENIHNGK